MLFLYDALLFVCCLRSWSTRYCLLAPKWALFAAIDRCIPSLPSELSISAEPAVRADQEEMDWHPTWRARTASLGWVDPRNYVYQCISCIGGWTSTFQTFCCENQSIRVLTDTYLSPLSTISASASFWTCVRDRTMWNLTLMHPWEGHPALNSRLFPGSDSLVRRALSARLPTTFPVLEMNISGINHGITAISLQKSPCWVSSFPGRFSL